MHRVPMTTLIRVHSLAVGVPEGLSERCADRIARHNSVFHSIEINVTISNTKNGNLIEYYTNNIYDERNTCRIRA